MISTTLNKLVAEGKPIDVKYGSDYIDDNLILLKVKQLEMFYKTLIQEYGKWNIKLNYDKTEIILGQIN